MQYETIHLKDVYPFLGENGCDPVLNAYLPGHVTGEVKQRPALLVLPGGGYHFVSAREAEPIVFNFLPDGYNVFLLTYSVAPNSFPTAIREVAAAMELIHANAEHWNTDTTRVAIMGFSAGGHLAGHYSNCFDCPEVRAVFPESKPVQAAVLCYPVITGDPAYTHKGTFKNLSGHAEPTQDDIDKFSLDKLVSESTPPTFLWTTREDQLVPVMNTILYTKALAEKGRPFSVHIYPFGPHGLSTVDAQTNAEEKLVPGTVLANAWMTDARKWLNITL